MPLSLIIVTDYSSMPQISTPNEGHTENLVRKMGREVDNGSSVPSGLQKLEKAPPFSDDADTLVATSSNRPNKSSMDYIIRSGIAGGIAGCVAKTCIAPLDRVKILFQTNHPQFAKNTSYWVGGLTRALHDIHGQDGIKGLFRGHSATLLRIYPYAAINYVAYEQYRVLLIGSKSQETWLRTFSAGAFAGVTSVFFTYPMDVIRVRLAFETKSESSSLADICKKIYCEQSLSKLIGPASKPTFGAAREAASAVIPRTGMINFYRGFLVTLLGMIPYAGTSFLTHDKIGNLFRLPIVRNYTTLAQPANAPTDKPVPLRAWAELTSGGVSGAVSQTVSYPLDVIRRRMQVGGAVGDRRRLRIGETAGLIFKERGISGFFIGLSIGYVKVVPLVAISFYTYERMKTHFGI